MRVPSFMYFAFIASLGNILPCSSFSIPNKHHRRVHPLATGRRNDYERNHSKERLGTALNFGRAPPVDVPPEEIKTTLAGKLIPFLSKFLFDRKTRFAIYKYLSHTVEVREFLAIAVIGWCSIPFGRAVYKAWYAAKQATPVQDFEDSVWYSYTNNMSTAAKFGGLIYFLDCVGVVLKAMGFKRVQTEGFTFTAANVFLFLWASLVIKARKKSILRNAFGDSSEEKAKAKVLDRVIDSILYFITATVILDRLRFRFGVTLSSIFAFGGVGTVVMSLASKDLATQLVSGLTVRAGGSFDVGDFIKLGDGTSGIVHKIGILYTEIRGSDEIITKIPNPQISNQRMSNVSRIDKCQVKQTLWFSYDDIDKIPAITLAIRDEIEASCPAVITDGSRPFSVTWSAFESDHLEVQVDCRFNLPPIGGVYKKNRQAVLEAIARAVRKKGVNFALPSYLAKNVELSVSDLENQKLPPIQNERELSPTLEQKEQDLPPTHS